MAWMFANSVFQRGAVAVMVLTNKNSPVENVRVVLGNMIVILVFFVCNEQKM